MEQRRCECSSAGFASVDIMANFPCASVKASLRLLFGCRGFSSSQLVSGQHTSGLLTALSLQGMRCSCMNDLKWK